MLNDAVADETAPFVRLRRCEIHSDRAYTFDFEDPLKKSSPVFTILSERIEESDNRWEATRYYVFGNSKANYLADTLRWQVTQQFMFQSTVRRVLPDTVLAGLGRYPIEALRPNLDLR